MVLYIRLSCTGVNLRLAHDTKQYAFDSYGNDSRFNNTTGSSKLNLELKLEGKSFGPLSIVLDL